MSENTAKQPKPMPPAKPAPMMRVKLAELHDDPELANIPTMKSLLADMEARLTRTGKTDSEGRAAILVTRKEKQETWGGFLDSVRREGIKEPVMVALRAGGGYWLRDGRNRRDATRQCNLDTIPAQLTTESAAAISLRTTAHRRGVSRGCIAFMAVQVYNHLLNNQPGPKDNSRTECVNSDDLLTIDDVAKRVGVSPRLVTQAVELAGLIDLHPRDAKDTVTSIHAGAGLGHLIAGLKGSKAEDGSGSARVGPVTHFLRGVESLVGQSHKYCPLFDKLPASKAGPAKHEALLKLASVHNGLFELFEIVVKNRPQLLAEAEKAETPVAKKKGAKS